MGPARSVRLAAACAVAIFTSAGVASAAAPERFHDEFADVDPDFCGEGLEVEFAGVVDGSFKAGTHGTGGLLYFLEHVRVAITFTNLDGGATITTLDRVLNKDLHVVDNGDGTITIVTLSTGNSTMYDETGKAIGRNPGQVRFELLIDLNGTPDFPDDDVLLSEELIKGSTGRSDDFCATAVPALT